MNETNNRGVLHVAMASDANYLKFVVVAVTSLMENNTTFTRVVLHLLLNNVNDEDLRLFRRCTAGYEALGVDYIDISNLPERLGVEVPPTIALTSYARLFLPSLISPEVDRILYLDCDTVVTADLGDLTAIKLTEAVGGVLDVLPDTRAKTDVGLNPDNPYVNAGVLLINLCKWREENIQQKFMDFLFEHEGNVHHHDQGIINGVCRGDVKLLHPRFNMHSSYFSHPHNLIAKVNKPCYKDTDVKEAIASPAIIHFTTGFYNRPWLRNCCHPKKSVFQKYWNKTPWKDEPLGIDNRSLAVKVLSWEFLNLPIWCYSGTQHILAMAKKILKR